VLREVPKALDVHIVSHTHWDREWYLPFEQSRLRLVAIVDRLIDLLERIPEFRHVHLDGQSILLEDYLEMRPYHEERLRRLIEDGRILVGPWYAMPDEFLVSGESLVRNLALGHRVARRFGTPMPVGYLPDAFGHVGQMPQILRSAGIDNAILWRGFDGPQAEYSWQAPDGSRVLMTHLPRDRYGNAARLDRESMVERAAHVVEAEGVRTSAGQVLLMNGMDHLEPHPNILTLARTLAEALDANVMHSSLPAYVDAVRSAVLRGDTSLGTVTGELRGGEEYATLLPGVLSSRTYLKHANAHVQSLLEHWAEPLAALVSTAGAPYPADELRYAWKTLLQNHAHNSICGCGADAVHDENMTRFARAQQVAEAVRDSALDAIGRTVPAAADDAWRCVAVNPGPQLFSGVIEGIVDLPFESAQPSRQMEPAALDVPVKFVPIGATITAARASDGRLAPVQILSEEYVTTFAMSQYETPWPLRARRIRLLWIGEVPPCGYATFDLLLDGTATPPVSRPRPVGSAERSAENGFLRFSINDDGSVDVVDRRTATRHVRCGAFEDAGDVGDEYTFSPPAGNLRITSDDATDVRVTRIHAGPLRAAFRIEFSLHLPMAASPDRSSRSPDRVENRVSALVWLDAGSPRVNWEVTVDNQSRDHRLRMLFPTGVAALTDVRAETAFGAARRPAHREVPADVRNEQPVSAGPTLSFVDAGGPAIGACVLGVGLTEYEAYPGDEIAGARIGMTLLRAVGALSRDDLETRPSGHAGPALATPGAQCLGIHTFRLAFEPRGAEPLASSLFARAAAFLSPPRTISAAAAAGSSAESASFLTIETTRGAVVMSACKRADDRSSLIVRLFNPDEALATVRVRTPNAVQRAYLVDLLEERTHDLPVRDGAVEVTLNPHVIRTIEIEN
jgi:mannosylglycerate hydrolase